MSCQECGSEKFGCEVYMDDGASWEEWICLDCGFTWVENWREEE